MANSTFNIPIQSATKNSVLHCKVTGVRRFRFRLWLFLALFRFGAWICPMTVVIEGPTFLETDSDD